MKMIKMIIVFELFVKKLIYKYFYYLLFFICGIYEIIN